MVMHLLFKFRFEENPFNLVSMVDEDVVVKRRDEVIDGL